MKQIDLKFETKCWENDWRLMAYTNHLQQMIENCSVNFQKKILWINNVKQLDVVKNALIHLTKDKIIDDILVVDDFIDRVLLEYEIDKDSFKGGYNYSSEELAGIYACKTKYLLHFSSDSYIPHEYKDVKWIEDAINIMEKNTNIAVANPTWNKKWNEAKKESFSTIDDFYVGYGFSDQCYLINTELFKQPVYNFHHEASDRYPAYGGELFEKRVDSYMRTHNLKRITSKTASYKSKNITKLQYLLEKYGLKKC